jgi:glycerophosphoryl diester phosphodiesterase
MPTLFNLQGHRGARGLKPENTLPSFEAAFDVGVTSIETDVHLTRDGVVVLFHNAMLGTPSCPTHQPGVEMAAEILLLSQLSLAELRRFRANRNPDPHRFPDQNPEVTPLADLFARRHGLVPYAIPTLEDLLRFAAHYAGEAGEQAGKSESQRRRAREVGFDLELKRVPFHPETINDGFDGSRPGLLEERIVEAVRNADVAARTTVRSFDHRCVRLLRQMEPRLRRRPSWSNGPRRRYIAPATCSSTKRKCGRCRRRGHGCCRGRSTSRTTGSACSTGAWTASPPTYPTGWRPTCAAGASRSETRGNPGRKETGRTW